MKIPYFTPPLQLFFRSIGVFSLLLLTVGLLLACGSASAPTATPTAATAAPAAAVSPTPLAAAASPATVAPPSPLSPPTPVAQLNPTPAGEMSSPATEQPTATPQPVTEPATATPAPLPTATTAPLPTPTPTPPPPTPTPTPAERDRAILTAFYHAMDGPNWADNTNWLTDAPLHEWYGVFGVGYEGVESLQLSANRLKGEIPAELGDLAGLKSLGLGGNQLIGCIPLTLVYNYELYLPNLSHLEPCENPDRAALVSFYHATGGPGWKNRQNWLTDEPLHEWYGVEVFHEGHGVEVDLRFRVRGLDLAKNGLSGEIPAALADLAELRELDLRGMTQWTSTGLTITGQLRGAIPPELGNLGNLEVLYLSENQLTGAIPPELGNLRNLRGLNLANNQLTGAIPPELDNLGNLGDLNLANNQLTGAIPPELVYLVNLWELDLSNNQLTGAIPPELGNLSNLRSLGLANNQLTGCVPRPLEKIRIDPAELGLEWCP